MSTCSRCGREFSCGMVDATDDAPCWCTQYPPMPMPAPGDATASCYCPECLAVLSSQRIAPAPG